MRRFLVLLLSFALLLTVAGCGTGGTTASEAPASDAQTSEAAPSAAPITTLRIGLDGEPSKLDYADFGGNYGSMFYANAVFSTLWVFTTDGEFHYVLATSYEYNADNTAITIKIRDDAKFSNGDPVTAEDVLFSFSSAQEVSGMRTSSVDFENSKVIDNTTLQLGIKQKSATQIEDFALITIASKSWTEERANEDHVFVNPLGSGPYYLKDGWATGKNMVLTKNPYYWDKDNLLYETIECYFIAEENTRFLQFTTGGLDLVYLTDSSNIDKMRTDSNYSLYSSPVQLNVGLIFDTETLPTFENQDLRLAICYAIDVNTIVKSICGSAYVPATSMLPSKSWAYKDTTYGYDPEKAKEYLAKSGVKDFTWTLTVHEGDLLKNVAEAIQGYLADVGIKMEINIVDMPTFFSEMMSGKMDSTITQYSGSSDPGSVLNSWQSVQPGNLNKTPPELNALIDEAGMSSDTQEKRTEMYHQIQDQVKEIGKILPLYEVTCNYAQVPAVDCSGSVQADGYLIPTFLTK